MNRLSIKSKRLVGAGIVTLALAGGMAALEWRSGPGQAYAQDAGKPTPTVQAEQTAPAADLSRIFRTVHNAMKGAVVNINMERDMEASPAPAIPDEMKKMLPPGFELGPGGPQHESGTGSGVIVSPDGYILTNNHVVDSASVLTVRLDDGRELKAKVIGTDPKTDLAVIKIEGKGLTYAKFGDSDAMDVGDWVLAFGSPFGFDQTMTQGIISAKGRQINIIGQNNPQLAGLTYENFLQTDAAINPGNSGGPLVNLKGEVIGINAAIASRSGAYNGIGFSIPSNDAKYIMDSLIKFGKVVRGYLGVGIADVRTSRAEATALGFTGTTGVLVKEVRPDSPGGKGGLQLNDVITDVNGKKIESMMELRTAIARTKPGEKIALVVFRGGKNVSLDFAVGEQPDTAVAAADKAPSGAFDIKDLGIAVSEGADGLKVASVEPGSLAASTGISAGDVIYQVQGKPVTNVAELRAALKTHRLSAGIQLSLRSEDGSRRSVFLRSA